MLVVGTAIGVDDITRAMFHGLHLGPARREEAGLGRSQEGAGVEDGAQTGVSQGVTMFVGLERGCRSWLQRGPGEKSSEAINRELDEGMDRGVSSEEL